MLTTASSSEPAAAWCGLAWRQTSGLGESSRSAGSSPPRDSPAADAAAGRTPRPCLPACLAGTPRSRARSRRLWTTSSTCSSTPTSAVSEGRLARPPASWHQWMQHGGAGSYTVLAARTSSARAAVSLSPAAPRRSIIILAPQSFCSSTSTRRRPTRTCETGSAPPSSRAPRSTPSPRPPPLAGPTAAASRRGGRWRRRLARTGRGPRGRRPRRPASGRAQLTSAGALQRMTWQGRRASPLGCRSRLATPEGPTTWRGRRAARPARSSRPAGSSSGRSSSRAAACLAVPSAATATTV